MRRAFLCLLLGFNACFLGIVMADVINDGTVIKNVTLVSAERSIPLPHAMVVIRNGRIAEVGTDLTIGHR